MEHYYDHHPDEIFDVYHEYTKVPLNNLRDSIYEFHDHSGYYSFHLSLFYQLGGNPGVISMEQLGYSMYMYDKTSETKYIKYVVEDIENISAQKIANELDSIVINDDSKKLLVFYKAYLNAIN